MIQYFLPNIPINMLTNPQTMKPMNYFYNQYLDIFVLSNLLQKIYNFQIPYFITSHKLLMTLKSGYYYLNWIIELRH
jgi:hypothetical protein